MGVWKNPLHINAQVVECCTRYGLMRLYKEHGACRKRMPIIQIFSKDLTILKGKIVCKKVEKFHWANGNLQIIQTVIVFVFLERLCCKRSY